MVGRWLTWLLNMINLIITALKFSLKKWKVFVISFVMVFVMVALPKLGITNSSNMMSPVPAKVDIFEQVRPKLEKFTNDFKLKKPNYLIPETRAASEYDQASAYAVIDMDTGEVILNKNLSKKLPIASITKIMTAVVALDLAPSVNEEFTVSEKASEMVPTKVMLKPGEKVSLELLLKSALLASANDSSQVIKEGLDQLYGEQVFIEAMNEKAKFLGMNNSHFTNPQGFDDPNHYSSVEDLAILSNYALKNYPFIKEIVAKDYEDMNIQGEIRFYLNNWNGLLGVYPGVSGIKIGNTGDAGYTTTVISERAGKRLFAVILGTPGVLERDLWTSQLLDTGFEMIAGLEPININEEQLRAKYASWKYER